MFKKYDIKSIISNLSYIYQWNLLVNIDDKISTSFSKFKEIIPPKDRFWADPFVVYRDNKYHIFFEECFFSDQLGHISLIIMDKNGNYSKPQVILKKPYHISYPFIFEFDSVFYMISESCTNNQTDIFQCTNFPSEWKYHTTVYHNIPLVDPTLFQKDGKWWIFACKAENDGTSKSNELMLFYSDNPLSEDWNPHILNPIVSDIRNARPAGKIFVMDNKIVRPAQNCFQVYGNGLSFNEIIKLNENEYEERQLEFFKPDWKNNLIGLHTFNYEKGCTVIDTRMKRNRFS